MALVSGRHIMRWLWMALAGVIVAGGTGCAATTEPRPRPLSPSTCTPIGSGERAWLGAEWQPFLSSVDACPVRDERGGTALLIVTVSAQRYYAPLPDGTITKALPKPLLVKPGGRVVGALPYSFPDDPPFELEVSFADWRDGFPWRVELFVRDPTVSGDHGLEPLRWDPTAQRFTGANEP